MTKDQNEFPQEFYDAFADGGWLGITTPRSTAVTDTASPSASCSRRSPPAGMNGASSIHMSIFGMHPVILHGSEELKPHPSPASSTATCTSASASPNPAPADTTGSPPSPGATATATSSTGAKVWIFQGDGVREGPAAHPDTTKFEGLPKDRRLTLFLTDLDRAKGRRPPIPKMGRNAVSSNELFIDGLRSWSRTGSAKGRGLPHPRRPEPERCLIAAEAFGIGRAACAAVRYGNEREVFGSLIGMNQGIQFPSPADRCAARRRQN